MGMDGYIDMHVPLYDIKKKGGFPFTLLPMVSM